MIRVVALLFILAGCASSPSDGGILRGSGIEVDPPQGYSDYCRANPREKECGG